MDSRLSTGISKRKRAVCALSGSKGFSLVEVLMAILITGLIAGGIYSVYVSFFKHASTQDRVLEAQQNARAALSIVEREMMNAGYAASTPDIITEATDTAIEFIYSDPSTDPTVSPTAGNRLQVKYALQTVGGVQYLTRRANNLTTGDVGATEQVIPYVQSLTIRYYDVNGATVTLNASSTQADRNTVKFVEFELTSQSKPETGKTPVDYTIRTQIRLRNIGIGQTALDSTEPSAPTNVQVRDPGQCGRLKVKWTESPDGDVMGYMIRYGVASGVYTGRINIPLTVLSSQSSGYSCTRASGDIQCTIFPTTESLAYTPSTAAAGTGTMYFVAVEAYDNSMNTSPFSTEVSGNPVVSNAVFDAGADDSTINPVKPVAVTGLTGADGSTDGQVVLSWDTYDTASSPDVTGFRIYRSASPFTYPIDPNLAGVDWIAGEPGSTKPNVSKSETTYTDNGPGLVGCRAYYYAIAPVNCDDTLISDAGGDPAEKKYAATDYSVAYGDGSGVEVDSPGGADTAPPDTVVPNPPGSFDVRAGWKRVALSLTQSSDADLYQTCLYANEGATLPGLLGTKDALNCYNVSPGIRLYESDGTVTTSEVAIGNSTSFWHNSMTSSTSTPSLAETGVYSYKAVSFDLCGNGSEASSAQATTTLCGEDPPVCPNVDALGYCQASPGKPPASTNLTAQGCGGNPDALTFSWTGVSSNLSISSSENNPYDLAGYRIFRSTNELDWSAATLLNTDAPYWGTSYSDTTASDGTSYFYRVVSTDCPYEKVSPTEATIRANMNSGMLRSVQIGPVYPGKIKRDEKCTGAGSCTQDDHREILTGASLDGSNTASPNSTFTHNTVTLFMNNTSGSTMTVQGASVSWVNSAAFLREIKIGGGRSGVGQTTTSIGAGSTTTVTGNPPYTSAVSNITLASTVIPANERYVPVTFDFRDAAGNRNVDMRDDQFLITLNVRNDSTGTTTCTSYMTVSLAQEGIIIPTGPSVTATQQNKPSSPTFGYAVPGTTGLNSVPSGSDGSIVVDPATTVAVSSNVQSLTTDETTGGKVAISSVKLYYIATAKTVTTAPTSGYTELNMSNTGGNTWRATIPSNDGKRVWYYVVAKDVDGNYDRDPEIGEGAYVYDQKNFSICDVTPSAPTTLTATASGSDVSLSWTAVTTYTSGSSIDATDSIKYRIYRGGTQIGTDQSGTSYSDTGLAAGVYSYTVKAINSCASPGPKVSDASNVAATCVGTSGQATITVSPTSIYRGDSFTVSIMDCLAINGAYATTSETLNLTSGFTGFYTSSTAPATYAPQITETGAATGTFNKTIATTSNASESGKLLTLDSDTITVYYPYANPTSKTISVIVDPCTNTPKAPTGLTGSVSGQNMTLNWTAVTQNTDNSAITDLAGYRVYERVCAKNKPNCTGADIIAEWFLRTTVASGTTTTLSADQGNVSQRIYYYKITAIDSCSTVKESGYSGTWNENN